MFGFKRDQYFDLRVANMLPEQLASNILSDFLDEILEHNQLVEFIRNNKEVNDPNLMEQIIEIVVARKNLIRVE
jgi:hypothetical protein